MIQGYEVGTSVKWNEDNVLTTGTIEKVYRENQRITLDGEPYDIEVSPNSPSYLIRTHDGYSIILGHEHVMLHHTNLHT